MVTAQFGSTKSFVMSWSTMIIVAVLAAGLAIVNVAADPAPTCVELGITASPNNCVTECQNVGSSRDTEKSRQVGSDVKCFCEDGTTICTDDPQCEDLLVFPGTAEEDCQTLCGQDSIVAVTDDVEFAGDATAANKDQTHLLVSCACDSVKQCGIDYVLFSDLTFLKACTTGATGDALGINNAEECSTYCTGVGFVESQYENGKCSCSNNSDGKSAVACDDNNANSGSQPEITDCFDQVGVSASDCPTPSPAAASPDGSAPTINSPSPPSAAHGKTIISAVTSVVVVAATAAATI